MSGEVAQVRPSSWEDLSEFIATFAGWMASRAGRSALFHASNPRDSRLHPRRYPDTQSLESGIDSIPARSGEGHPFWGELRLNKALLLLDPHEKSVLLRASVNRPRRSTGDHSRALRSSNPDSVESAGPTGRPTRMPLEYCSILISTRSTYGL